MIPMQMAAERSMRRVPLGGLKPMVVEVLSRCEEEEDVRWAVESVCACVRVFKEVWEVREFKEPRMALTSSVT